MKYKLIILAVLFLPVVGNAQVLFSEIAWMGTTESANNEWMEIYNFSSNPTDLSGWTISDGISLNIELAGTMPPHGVFLLERTDDTSVPEVSAALIYTGVLTNTGATLTIKDASGQVVVELVGGENWVNIGGNNELKYTAQSTRAGAWVTGTPTPGLPNIEEDTEIPDENDDDNNNDGDDDTQLDTPTKTSTGGGSSSRKKTTEAKNQPLGLSINAPKIAYVNQEISFEAIPNGAGRTTRNSLTYLWNFGDTSTTKIRDPKHIFKYPGEYLVVVEAGFAKQITQQRHEIEVLQTSFELTYNSRGDAILTNKAPQEVNISGFKLKSQFSFLFPRLSILKAGGTIVIPKEKFGLQSSNISLYDTQNTLIISAKLAPVRTVLGASYAAPKVAYMPPVVQKSETIPTIVEKVVMEENEQIIIRIGDNTDIENPDKNFMVRIFGRIFNFFKI